MPLDSEQTAKMHILTGIVSVGVSLAFLTIYALDNPGQINEVLFNMSLVFIAGSVAIKEYSEAHGRDPLKVVTIFHLGSLGYMVVLTGFIFTLSTGGFNYAAFFNAGTVLYAFWAVHHTFTTLEDFAIFGPIDDTFFEFLALNILIYMVPWGQFGGPVATTGSAVKTVQQSTIDLAQQCAQDVNACYDAIVAFLESVHAFLQTLPFYNVIRDIVLIFLDAARQSGTFARFECALQGGGLSGQLSEGEGAAGFAECVKQRANISDGGTETGGDFGWNSLSVSSSGANTGTATLQFDTTINSRGVGAGDFNFAQPSALTITGVTVSGSTITVDFNSGGVPLTDGDPVELTVSGIWSEDGGKINSGSCTANYNGGTASGCTP